MWHYARDLVTVHYNPAAARPDIYHAAISELGYDVKAPSREQSKKEVAKQLSQLCVPTEAPKTPPQQPEKQRQQPVQQHQDPPPQKSPQDRFRDAVDHFGRFRLNIHDLLSYCNVGDAVQITVEDCQCLEEAYRLLNNNEWSTQDFKNAKAASGVANP